MPDNPQSANRFFNKVKIGGFIASAAVIMLLISFNKINYTVDSNNHLNTDPKELSFCEKIDSIAHEQTRGFSSIKGKVSFNEKDEEIWFRSTIDLSADSAYIVSLNKLDISYRGYFSTKANNDSVSSAKLYDSLKSTIRNCLPTQWSNYGDLIDSDNNFPFTRFVKDSTQIELYYRKNSDGSTYTIGLVVIGFK